MSAFQHDTHAPVSLTPAVGADRDRPGHGDRDTARWHIDGLRADRVGIQRGKLEGNPGIIPVCRNLNSHDRCRCVIEHVHIERDGRPLRQLTRHSPDVRTHPKRVRPSAGGPNCRRFVSVIPGIIADPHLASAGVVNQCQHRGKVLFRGRDYFRRCR